MMFPADFKAGAVEYPWTLAALQNPVTRFEVRVEPPIEVRSGEEWDSICSKFCAYCQAAWEGPVRLSPEVIDAGWLQYVHVPALPLADRGTGDLKDLAQYLGVSEEGSKAELIARIEATDPA